MKDIGLNSIETTCSRDAYDELRYALKIHHLFEGAFLTPKGASLVAYFYETYEAHHAHELAAQTEMGIQWIIEK